MIIIGTIIGVRDLHYTNSSGREVSGRTLYYTFPNEDIVGCGADSVYLPDSKYKHEIFATGDNLRIAVGKGYKEFIERY